MIQNEILLKNNLITLILELADNTHNLSMTKQLKDILAVLHPYKITAPKSNGKRWQTYVKNKDGCRKLVQAPTEHELLVKLAEHYCINENLEI